MKPPKTQVEHLRIDGVDYQIDVEEDAGGFWGSWKCVDCKQAGRSTGKCSTFEEAMQGAKNNLAPHHQVLHGPRGRP
ncbi:MAG: hypothetical protein ACTHN5_24045 [Phycisphaerae bacterium]